ncbi:lactadherin-like [Diadema antillarum]|uniref:lactadherin-like n=1 Tax=Diadema antillarum TaxID=105358 RepID=UPI003A8C6420
MDRNTVVYNALPRPQNCQSVRVAPLTYYRLMCLRLEVYEQTPGVPNDVVSLGMESEDIPDSSFEVSGSASLGSGDLWRLNHNPSYADVVPNGCEWIQVDLQTQREVVGIATQGIFTANWDSQTVVFNRLPDPVFCRYVRIIPVSWNPQANTVFRMELYGSVDV